MSLEHRRLARALLLSLLIHALLLSLTFGGQGHWLPGLGFPWQVRRVDAPDLRVVVVPAPVNAGEPAVTPVVEPRPQERVEPPVARLPAAVPSESRASTPRRSTAAMIPKVDSRAEVDPEPDAATGAAPVQTPTRAGQRGDAVPRPIAAPAATPLARTDDATPVVTATSATPAPVVEPAPGAPSAETPPPSLPDAGDAARATSEQAASERAVEPARLVTPRQEGQRPSEQPEAARLVAEHQEAARVEAARAEAARVEAGRVEDARVEAARADAARVEAARAEAARVEAARVEAARVEAARVEAARAEAARVEAARAEAARVEAARVEAARVEAARAEAARVEAARVEAARVEAARAEAARAEAARVEAARVEAARAEAARVEAARAEAARVDAAQEAAARREAALRAIGRQLDEEAARRDAAARLPPSSSSARRYRLFGRADPNAELILYAEAWSRKIQMNMTFDMVREAAKQPHADPLVTVAIRSDGSVESVTFVLSSGVAALDEAIRRVVHSQTPYQAFPPGLAREYDVIEIRRTWYFDVAIRLY